MVSGSLKVPSEGWCQVFLKFPSVGRYIINLKPGSSFCHSFWHCLPLPLSALKNTGLVHRNCLTELPLLTKVQEAFWQWTW